MVAARRGVPREGIPFIQRAVTMLRELCASAPGDVPYEYQLAQSVFWLGELYLLTDQNEEALSTVL